jgi:hypothetical protein
MTANHSVGNPSAKEVNTGGAISPITSSINKTVLAKCEHVGDEMKQSFHSCISDSGNNEKKVSTSECELYSANNEKIASTSECELYDCNSITYDTQPFLVHSTGLPLLVQPSQEGLMLTNDDTDADDLPFTDETNSDLDRAVTFRLPVTISPLLDHNSGNIIMSLPCVGDSPLLNERPVIESINDNMDCLDGNTDIVSACQAKQPQLDRVLSINEDMPSLLLEEARTDVQLKSTSKVEVINDSEQVIAADLEDDALNLNENCCGRETHSTVEMITDHTLAQTTNSHQSMLCQHGDTELVPGQQDFSEPDSGLQMDIALSTVHKLHDSSAPSESQSGSPSSASDINDCQGGKFMIHNRTESHDQLVPSDHMIIEQLTSTEDTSIGHGVEADKKDQTGKDYCLLSTNASSLSMTWNQIEDGQDEPQPKRIRTENTLSAGNTEPCSGKSGHDGLPVPCFPQTKTREKSQCQIKRPRLRLGLSKREKCPALHRNRIY